MTDLRKKLAEEASQLIQEAETQLPGWAEQRLKKAYHEEEGVAETQIKNILRNLEIAREKNKPICQDTGLITFYIEVGRDLQIDFSIQDALEQAVKDATGELPMRPSIVNPLTRKNTEDNTGQGVPHIEYQPMEGDEIKLTVLIKGGGSENVARQKMFLPDEANEIPGWVVDMVKEAGAKPCPPIYIGLGIGGGLDISAKLAKKALIKEPNTSKGEIGKMENKILKKVNQLEVGPMGLGGNTTALGVSIETASCHTASLPVALNVQCWATRTATTTIEAPK
ncbi:Tartrate dehydratase alpha subunit/Fumarate hydratase class I N-terminal domain TtdA [Methanonatronarchaeum thermophilum]|uniref:Tartrate dehydratase alpha subunit/Fumarate hydratase class I N-terminal domain TtdA n=1 Tax=Methanonatronarchaeum thermophilum TaxID=1927129 RepID=A0A1Y3GG73_9EURY|nr:fumarate hydratase [Methanonatronarchaeum thermophilum]OUJ19313.1 Tartrate dehydratase alpha subunit/Fumarate hydratase class I N-terminal domain TtdA [Methanonatronarchaeum thermophilum]